METFVIKKLPQPQKGRLKTPFFLISTTHCPAPTISAQENDSSYFNYCKQIIAEWLEISYAKRREIIHDDVMVSPAL